MINLENIKIIQNPQDFLYLNKTYQNINDHIDIKKTKLNSIWVQKTKLSTHLIRQNFLIFLILIKNV